MTSQDYCIYGFKQSEFMAAIRKNNNDYVSNFLNFIDERSLYNIDVPAYEDDKKATYSKTMCDFLMIGFERSLAYEREDIFNRILNVITEKYEYNHLANTARTVAMGATLNNLETLSKNKKINELGDKYWIELLEYLFFRDDIDLPKFIYNNKLISDLNKLTVHGKTLLEIAAVSSNLGHVENLLKNGFDKNTKNIMGISILDVEKKLFKSEIMEYIQNFDYQKYKKEIISSSFKKTLPEFNRKKEKVKSLKTKRIKGFNR